MGGKYGGWQLYKPVITQFVMYCSFLKLQITIVIICIHDRTSKQSVFSLDGEKAVDWQTSVWRRVFSEYITNLVINWGTSLESNEFNIFEGMT